MSGSSPLKAASSVAARNAGARAVGAQRRDAGGEIRPRRGGESQRRRGGGAERQSDPVHGPDHRRFAFASRAAQTKRKAGGRFSTSSGHYEPWRGSWPPRNAASRYSFRSMRVPLHGDTKERCRPLVLTLQLSAFFWRRSSDPDGVNATLTMFRQPQPATGSGTGSDGVVVVTRIRKDRSLFGVRRPDRHFVSMRANRRGRRFVCRRAMPIGPRTYRWKLAGRKSDHVRAKSSGRKRRDAPQGRTHQRDRPWRRSPAGMRRPLAEIS